MNSQTIVMCVVAFIIGMLLAHMLKDVCGCKTVEGLNDSVSPAPCGEEDALCGGDVPNPKKCCKPDYVCSTRGTSGYVMYCTKKSAD